MLLRRATERVRAAEIVRQGARGERARAVRAVPVDPGARVADNRLPRLDAAVARMMVWKGCVRPRGDDGRERRRLGSLLVQEALHRPGELGLRATDELLPREALVRLVGDPGGPADRVELLLVLDRAEPRHDAPGGNEPRAVGGERLVPGDRHVVGLEGDRPFPELSEPPPDVLEETPGRGYELDPLDLPRRLLVAAVREEEGRIRASEKGRVRALETAQVAHVDGVGDEKRPCSEPLRLGAQAPDAARHDGLASHSSASR